MFFSFKERASQDSSHLGIGWLPDAHLLTEAFDTPVSLARSVLVISNSRRVATRCSLSIVTPCKYLYGDSQYKVLTM